MTKAFSPAEARGAKRHVIPDFVLAVVNQLLAEGFNERGINVPQQEIIDRVKLLTGSDAFNMKWLDFESLFEDEGWIVKYDKPGYNESYDAFFVFTPKK
jgi:hypothetical protein